MDSSLSNRLRTAAIGIPLVLLIVWQGGWWLSTVVILLALMAMRELLIATRAAGTPIAGAMAYPLLLAMLIIPLRDKNDGYWLFPTLAVLLLSCAGVFRYTAPKRLTLNSIALTLLAVFYVGLFAFLPLLRAVPEFGHGLMWLVLLGVWTGDSAAYFVGRAVGRRKLTPLSPGKTWEGINAGVFASVLVAVLVGTRIGLGFGHSLALGLIVGIMAPLGDLVESFWKRELGVKDMGSLLPGHGGVLDRCDSLLFAGAAVYMYLAFWL